MHLSNYISFFGLYYLLASAASAAAAANGRLRALRGERAVLGEVRAHISLEVEVGEFVRFSYFEKFAEFAVRKNATAVLGVLERVFADVGVDFTGDFSARHFSAVGLLEEGSKFSANKSGLDEARGRAVAGLAATFLAGFLGSTEFAVRALLEKAEARSKRSELSADSGEVGHKLVEGVVKRRFRRFSRFSRGGYFFFNRGRFGLGGGGLGRFALSGGFLGALGHFIIYYSETFLSVFKV